MGKSKREKALDSGNQNVETGAGIGRPGSAMDVGLPGSGGGGGGGVPAGIAVINRLVNGGDCAVMDGPAVTPKSDQESACECRPGEYARGSVVWYPVLVTVPGGQAGTSGPTVGTHLILRTNQAAVIEGLILDQSEPEVLITDFWAGRDDTSRKPRGDIAGNHGSQQSQLGNAASRYYPADFTYEMYRSKQNITPPMLGDIGPKGNPIYLLLSNLDSVPHDLIGLVAVRHLRKGQ
jgi:hypothetical protein